MNRRQLLQTLGATAAVGAFNSLRTSAGRTEEQPEVPSFKLPRGAKHCIFFFMEGAPSQFDLYSYKPKLKELDGQAPPQELLENTRFAFIEKSTAVLRGAPRAFSQHGDGGMWFSDLLPNLAGQADRLCHLAAVQTTEVNHHPAQLVMQTGHALPGHPSLGAWVSHALGSENKNLPPYVALSSSRMIAAGSSVWGSGFLPASAGGVLFGNGSVPVYHLAPPPGIGSWAEQATIQAIQSLNSKRAGARPRSETYELALRLQSEIPELIRLDAESEATRSRYGIGRTDPDITVNSARKPPSGSYNTFAEHCVLARRLVERGVRMVNVFSGSWDMHDSVDREMPFFAGMIDQPLAALLEDLSATGLLEETLVVMASEFGRTPLAQLVSGEPGRDHHAPAFSVFLAGAGVQGGLTYGETDEIGWLPTRDAVDVASLHATILRLMGIDHEKLSFVHDGLEQRLIPVGKKARLIESILS